MSGHCYRFPRILIFGEATSVLDHESENIIQHNLKAIRKGRTVSMVLGMEHTNEGKRE